LRGKLRLTVLMERIKQWPRGWFRGKR